MTTELEAKLIPCDGFQMPGLDTLPGTEIAQQPMRELDATYYDTPDLELARWGITLRHRKGDSGPPWTLKLPERFSRTRLIREELSFDGEEYTVPSDARDLIRGFTQSRALTRVARLHTTRSPIRILDGTGEALIEIVDDSVALIRGEQQADQFREIEVEAETDGPECRIAMKSAVAALRKAGCRVGHPLPKLVRALGEQAQQPPSIVVAPVDVNASTADLIAHLAASSAADLLTQDPGVRLGHDPEAVHLYRVATRRLRADLHTFARFLDDEPTDKLRNELQRLGQAAGPVRDCDVLVSRFAARSLSDLDQPALSALLAHLTSARHHAHSSLLETIRSDRYDETLRSLIAYARLPPIAPDAAGNANRPASRFARRVVKRRWNQLVATVGVAGNDPTDTDLHQIRIAAKRCRYAAEAVSPVIGKPARRFAAAVEAVQNVLGDYHDTVVAEAWLRHAAAELADCRLAIGGLIAIERHQRLTLRRAWSDAWRHASRHQARAWL